MIRSSEKGIVTYVVLLKTLIVASRGLFSDNIKKDIIKAVIISLTQRIMEVEKMFDQSVLRSMKVARNINHKLSFTALEKANLLRNSIIKLNIISIIVKFRSRGLPVSPTARGPGNHAPKGFPAMRRIQMVGNHSARELSGKLL